jgi:hypothetical protein
MRKPIYASKQHEIIIKDYMTMTKEFVKDLSNETRFNNYLDIFDIVIDYHNNYGSGLKEENWHDWVMILPINISVMTNGYLAAIETKRNSAIVRSYRLILTEMVHDVVDKIEKIEPIND